LQKWGIRNVTRAAEKTEMLDDDSAEKAMYPHLRASRRLMRAIRIWLQHEKSVDTEERDRLWAKVDKRAKGLYGKDISLPLPDRFLGETPAEFIDNLRSWLEGNTKAETKGDEGKKTFFNSLFGR